MAARRWSDLSASYRKRFTDYARGHPELGKTPAQIWRSPSLRSVATGHGETPRTPMGAVRDPERYQQYIARNWDVVRAAASTRRGEKAAEAAVARQADEGRIPVSLYVDADDSQRRQTFMTLEDAKSYLEEVRHLVNQKMAWIVLVMHNGQLEYEVWIMRNTP